MDSIDKVLTPVNTVFTKNVVPILQHPVVHLIISWIIILNVIHSLDEIPMYIRHLILNPVTKVLAVFLGFFYATNNLSKSIGLTLVIVILYHFFGFFVEQFQIITQTADRMPGCVNVMVSDLMKLFNGDQSKLKQAMINSGVPYNVSLTDDNSPLIATYLVNHGYEVGDMCAAPK